MSVAALLASCGAALSLWLGSSRHMGSAIRGYRWLTATALFWFAGLIVQQVLSGPISSSAVPLSLADVAPLLALAPAVVGILVLASGTWEALQSRSDGGTAGSLLPRLADGYVMAVALIVIGWVTVFGGEYHKSGERPGTFLLDLIHPLADVVVLGALLPVLTAAWRRVTVPYLALVVLTVADALAVGARLSGGHLGVGTQAAQIAASFLLGIAPWLSAARVPARVPVLVPSRIPEVRRISRGSRRSHGYQPARADGAIRTASPGSTEGPSRPGGPGGDGAGSAGGPGGRAAPAGWPAQAGRR